MKSFASFLGGIIFALVALVLVGYFAVKAGFVPANADSKPTALERWVAKTALNAALERDTSMPSFAPTLQDEQIWKIAMFLKQMDKLPPAVDAEWKKIPSVAATALPSGLHRRLELLQWNHLGCTTGERTYRIGRSSGPIDMKPRLSRIRPLREKDKGGYWT
jgi:hypothetical protein